MDIPDKIYLSLYGHITNIVKEYFTRQEWHYLKTIKKNNPQLITKAIIASSDKEAAELVKYNPYIDEIEIHDISRVLETETRDKKIQILNRSNFESLEKIIIDSKLEKSIEKPKIYLTEKDIRKITSLTGRKKYIITHDKIKDILDLPDIISIKNISLNPNLNIRIRIELISKANGFIGIYSPEYIVASEKNINTILIIPPEDKKDILKKYHRDNQKILCYSLINKKSIDEKRFIEKRIIDFFIPKKIEKVLTKQEKIDIEELTKSKLDTTKISLWVYGGFGDCLLAYMNGGVGKYNRGGKGRCGKGSMKWTYLRSLKTRFPNVKTRAIVISGNSQSSKLMECSPYIDEVIYSPTLYKVNSIGQKIRDKVASLSGEYIDIDEINIDKYCNEIKNKIYLDNENGIFYNKILEEAGKNYILMHPFASTLLRRPVGPKEYLKLSDRIYKELGYKTIIVGKDYTKKTIKPNGNTISESTMETFEYENDHLINIVNKTDLLVSSQLAIKSLAIIGAWSCHTTNGLALNKPTVILTNRRSLSYLRPISKKRFPEALKKNLTLITNRITEEAIVNIIKHLEGEIKE